MHNRFLVQTEAVLKYLIELLVLNYLSNQLAIRLKVFLFLLGARLSVVEVLVAKT